MTIGAASPPPPRLPAGRIIPPCRHARRTMLARRLTQTHGDASSAGEPAMAHPADEPVAAERAAEDGLDTVATPCATLTSRRRPPLRGARGLAAGLDGLRAIAVLAVLCFHARPRARVPGGFLGVDVFFVIAGFLITTLLLASTTAHGRIDIAGFWLPPRPPPPAGALPPAGRRRRLRVARRARRRWRGSGRRRRGLALRHELVPDRRPAVVLRGDRTAVAAAPPVVAGRRGAVLPVLAARSWPWRWLVLRRRGAFVLTIAARGRLGGLDGGLFDPDGDPSRVYYGTDTRLFGLLIGAGLAFVWGSRRRHRRPALPGAGLGRLRRGPDVVAVAALVGTRLGIPDGRSVRPEPSIHGAAVAVALVAGRVIAGGRPAVRA